jgi:hypothetical protein
MQFACGPKPRSSFCFVYVSYWGAKWHILPLLIAPFCVHECVQLVGKYFATKIIFNSFKTTSQPAHKCQVRSSAHLRARSVTMIRPIVNVNRNIQIVMDVRYVAMEPLNSPQNYMNYTSPRCWVSVSNGHKYEICRHCRFLRRSRLT